MYDYSGRSSIIMDLFLLQLVLLFWRRRDEQTEQLPEPRLSFEEIMSVGAGQVSTTLIWKHS